MLEMRDIRKRYGAIQANDGISLTATGGRIVGLLGENGSGKSTLMKVLFGVVKPDSGSIRFRDQVLANHTPREAIAAGIGMIHQHFMLVEAMTVLENVLLASKRTGVQRSEVADRIRKTSADYGLDLQPEAVVADLSFGRRQRVEIVKALLEGADLLVLDEPTSNLSPPEIKSLLGVLRKLAGQGKAIIFITHKLGEVFDVCDEVVVLRDGKVAGKSLIAEATRKDLAHMMVGRDISVGLSRTDRQPGKEVLVARKLTWKDSTGRERLKEVDFSLHEGEILAVAGVDGNGQSDLVDVLAGLKPANEGSIELDGRDITRATVGNRLKAGLAYIPVDRAATSLVAGMTIEENLGLRDFDRSPYRRGIWLNRREFREQARAKIAEFSILARNPDMPVRTLSGGNQQKVVIAREIGRNPRALIAFQATWGLDPGATRFVIDQMIAMRNRGGAVLYIASELDEVLMVGDRIGVMSNGRLIGVVPRQEVDLARIGLRMAGGHDDVASAIKS